MWWPWKGPLCWLWPWKGPLVWLWCYWRLRCVEFILGFHKCVFQFFYLINLFADIWIEHVACRCECILPQAKVVSAWNSAWKSLTSPGPVEVDFQWFNTFVQQHNSFARSVQLHVCIQQLSDDIAWLLAFFCVVHISFLSCLLVEEYGREWRGSSV